MATVETRTFAVEGMHCASCALLVDDVLADLPGVAHVETSRRRERSIVGLDPAATTPQDVVAAIQELGYTARLLS
jgi:copper chaperone